ncbi:uncharacterized protein ACR2FA_010882 [Aphomia sociella]
MTKISRLEKIYITPDKTSCLECSCYPKEDPYRIPKKLSPCQKSPLMLYELATVVVDRLEFPEALSWNVGEVSRWIEEVVALPQYRECIKNNRINGMRLLILEDPSKLPDININDFQHIQRITKMIRRLFGTEFIRFARSIGLPPRKPLTHCTWFKSRTGPSWGIRKDWNRSDVLRWLKIILPVPVYRDHWDMVWYHKPDFPKVMFARIPKTKSQAHIPHYEPIEEACKEYLVPRKFRFQTGISEPAQMIWMEHRPDSPVKEYKKERKEKQEKKKEKRVKLLPPKECRLMPKRISLTRLTGKDLVLARRKMAQPKFMP